MQIKQHCCVRMTDQLTYHCPDHADRFACPDALIHYASQSDTYGLIIHDGGSATIAIHYCPWCSTALYGIAQNASADDRTPAHPTS